MDGSRRALRALAAATLPKGLRTRLRDLRARLVDLARAGRMWRNWLRWEVLGKAWRPDRLQVIEIHHPYLGLFAHLGFCLDLLSMAEDYGFEPYFVFSSPQYLDPDRGSSWFDSYFCHLHLSDEQIAEAKRRIAAGRVTRIFSTSDILPKHYEPHFSVAEARRLIATHIGVQPAIHEKVEAFCKEHFRGRSVFGVHYRGTDRGSEAPIASYEEVIDLVRAHLARHPEFEAVFVASDERDFVAALRTALDGVEVIHSGATQIADRERAVHLEMRGDRYLKGEEAVLDCLLLSRCAALLKSPSQLSGWSLLFGGDIPAWLVNEYYADTNYFPDRLLPRANVT